MDETTTEQVNKVPNPDGKGGFGDNPQNINAGGRPKNAESFAYWYRQFKEMTVAQLESWQDDNPRDTRTVASDLAFTRIINAKKDLKEFQEIADRSEGKAVQTMKHEGDLITGIKVEIVNGTDEV
jgi:hypothetical protein